MVLFMDTNCKVTRVNKGTIQMRLINKLSFLACICLFCLNAFADCDRNCSILDFNSDNAQDASKDGVLVIRHLFGLTDESLVEDLRQSVTDSTLISVTINALDMKLDIDGNGAVDALTDGLLLYRYLDGHRGQSLIKGVIAPNAKRFSADHIEVYLESLSQ